MKIELADAVRIPGSIYREVYLDTDKLTDEQRQQLLEALQKPKGGRLWLPKDGEEYCWVDGIGQVSMRSTYEDRPFHRQNFAQGNIFKTKAEAEKHSEYLKALYEVKKWIAENCAAWEPDWNNESQSKWYIYYSIYIKHNFDSLVQRLYILPYLETEQQCLDLIAAQSDNLKIIFGVES